MSARYAHQAGVQAKPWRRYIARNFDGCHARWRTRGGSAYSGVMSKKPQPKPDNPAQSQRFIDAAKEAGVDETGEGFDRAFKRVVPKSAPKPKGAIDRQSF